MYQKDSVVIILRAGEDGYSSSYYIFNRSPPPAGRLMDILESVPEEEPARDFEGIVIPGEMTPGVRTRQDRISADKTALKTEIGQLVDNFFDV